MRKKLDHSPSLLIEARHYLQKKKNLQQMDEVDQVMDAIICGCGNADAAEQALYELFGMFKSETDGSGTPQDFVEGFKDSEFVKKYGEGIATLLLYFMNELGLAEHGGSVNGSWLSPLGKEVKKLYWS